MTRRAKPGPMQYQRDFPSVQRLPYEAKEVTMSPKSNTPDLATLMAQLAALTAENEKLKLQKTSRAPSLKVSEKGAVSVYGLGRFPVTLYKAQMFKLLDMAEEIRTFIAANDAKLSQGKAENHVQIVPPAKDAAVAKVG